MTSSLVILIIYLKKGPNVGETGSCDEHAQGSETTGQYFYLGRVLMPPVI